jgi:hypothetical protein
MRFTLSYRGELKSNRGAREKHALRRQFHSQLKELWSQKPLSTFHGRLLDRTVHDQSTNVVRDIGGFAFAPLICERVALVAELRVTLYRPQSPGALVGSGGDIDNRIKTVLDALKVPFEPNALPNDEVPREGETPFFCLLEDDKLITALSVTTERLLEPNQGANEVLMLIDVTVRQIQVFMGTIGLGR